jgi:hypothetical protein
MSFGMQKNNSTTNDVIHVCGSIIFFNKKNCKKIEEFNFKFCLLNLGWRFQLKVYATWALHVN